MSKFYTFYQNNAAGVFVTDTLRGIGTTVVIEANSAEEANDFAENIGIDFDDLCECCGTRWDSVRDSDGETSLPSQNNEIISEFNIRETPDDFKFVDNLKTELTYTHHLNGEITALFVNRP